MMDNLIPANYSTTTFKGTNGRFSSIKKAAFTKVNESILQYSPEAEPYDAYHSLSLSTDLYVLLEK